MKQIRILFASVVMLLCSLSANAQTEIYYNHSFTVDGINYDISSSDAMTVSVTYNGYADRYDEYGTIIEQVYNPNGYVSGSVTIPETVTYNGNTYRVTSIGERAFYSCSGLTSIEIPNSVTSIGYGAFFSCSGLTSVTIPNSVTSIGSEAFSDCVKLTSIIVDSENKVYDSRNNCNAIIETASNKLIAGCKTTVIPNSVTSIGSYAFYLCSGLTSIAIPNSVTSIGEYAFSGTGWYNNQPNGVVYAGKVLYNYKGTMPANTSITVKEGTVSISESAFYRCSGLTSVEIPNSVTSIGEYAFSGTGWYNNQPNGVVYAGKVLYDYKGTIPANTSITVKEGTVSISESAFYSCSGLTSIEIPNSVTSIGSHAFYNCSGLTSIEIPNSVTSIGSHAFYNCSGLTSVTIGNSVTSIGDYAFYACDGLTSVTIGNSVTSIGSSAFRGCSGLTSIAIPNSVTSIGSSAFYNCSGLTSIAIPNSVTSIGSYAFQSCSGLTSVHISDIAAWCNIEFSDNTANPLYYAKHLYMNGKEIKDLVIPEGVTSIGSYAFYDCDGLTSVTIGNSVTSIGDYAFQSCSGLTSVHISDIAAWCNIEFSDNTANPLYYAKHLYMNGKEIKDLVIPESVTSIGSYAFYNCSYLTSIEIPNSVTSIGSSAFSYCSGLEAVYINATTPLAISSSTYWGNSKVFVMVPADLFDTYKTMNYWSEIHADGRLLTIGDKIDYDADVTAKSNTSGLLSEIKVADLNKVLKLKISGTINSYDIIVLNQKMPKLRYLDLTDARIVACDHEYYTGYKTQNDVVGGYMFYNQGKYTEIKLPATAMSIGSYAFSSCDGLTSVTIGNSVTSIGDYAFQYCDGLTSVHISDIAAWCNIKFSGYTANPLYYAKHLYMNGKEIKDLVIPEGVTRIGSSAFYDCDGLTSVTIGNSVTSIGDYAFYACDGLTSVTIGNSVTSIGSSAFRGCSGLTSVTIPSSVRTIGSYAFFSCSKLKSVYTRTVEPTEIDQYTFSSSTYSSAILYVPKTSYNLYWLHPAWSQFANLAEYDAPYDNFYVENDYVLDDETGNVQGTPDVDLKPGSGLVHEGSSDQNLGDVHVNSDGSTTGSIIGNGHINAEKLFFDILVNKNKWYFFCFPYKIMLDKITHPGDYVWRKYDGEKRATNGSGGWIDVVADCLNRGEGYIYQTNQSGTLSLEVLKEQFGKFDANDVSLSLNVYASSNANNASWNLLGNPFASYYDIADMGFDAPVTIWNGSSYEAMRPGDDDYILKPFEAFFVQKPNNVNEINFKAGKRMTYLQSKDKKKKVAMKSAAESKRFVINLTISDGSNSDKTRVVYNDNHLYDYEIGCDAAKFMSTEAVPQLYTVDNRGVKYSINERPEGEVAMGYVASKQGMYTISAVSMDKAVLLKDLERGVIHDLSTGDYTFSSEAGTFEGRFVLLVNSEATDINGIKAQTGVEIAVVDGGISISGAAGKTVNIYNVGGQLVAANVTDGVVALASGTYIVSVDGISTKVVVM